VHTSIEVFENQNNDVAGFSATVKDLNRLNSMTTYTALEVKTEFKLLGPQLTALLTAFNLPVNGSVAGRKMRLLNFIGVVMK
jgi:hypothetical protein